MFTVEAVVTLLLMMGSADQDKGNVPMALRWLGGQLEAAGMLLEAGGQGMKRRTLLALVLPWPCCPPRRGSYRTCRRRQVLYFMSP